MLTSVFGETYLHISIASATFQTDVFVFLYLFVAMNLKDNRLVHGMPISHYNTALIASIAAARFSQPVFS